MINIENKLTHNGIVYTRYIASWKNSGGKVYRGGLFERWLRETQELTDDEIREMFDLIESGKCELETSADKFLDENIRQHNSELEIANVIKIPEGSDLKSAGVCFEFEYHTPTPIEELPDKREISFVWR